MAEPTASKGQKRNVSVELKSGEPWLGANPTAGNKFLGWVLVQVWDGGSGDGITVNWSGDRNSLLKRAADRLAKDATAPES